MCGAGPDLGLFGSLDKVTRGDAETASQDARDTHRAVDLKILAVRSLQAC
jgi:hypothetical protein